MNPLSKEVFSKIDGSGYFNRIDLHFARFVAEASPPADADIFMAAALLSNLTANGHVCLELARYSGKGVDEGTETGVFFTCPDAVKWRLKLTQHPWVGKPGEEKPLVLDTHNRLYLFRYWEYEKRLAEAILERAADDIEDFDLQIARRILARLFPASPGPEPDFQKIACAVAACKRICVVSGGPGTGKTTTIARLCAFLLELYPEKKLKIRLCAPTGKAAARLAAAMGTAAEQLNCPPDIKAAIPKAAGTIHRLLKPVPGSPYFHYNAANLLPADIVVVDEASMVDLALMSKLMQAVSREARFVLVGDKDQLASVAPGAVLGDICDRENRHLFPAPFVQKITALSGESIDTCKQEWHEKRGLPETLALLKKSYRFSVESGIGRLGRAVINGDTAGALACLQDSRDRSTQWEKIASPSALSQRVKADIVNRYAHYLKAAEPVEALARLRKFQILCAVRHGPFGVYALNRLVEALLAESGLLDSNRRPSDTWYAGRPVLITENDYSLGLFNGDMGLACPLDSSDSGTLFVFFPDADSKTKMFVPHRLPAHETAFAMTVHKSQGSEFDEVVLVLPDRDTPVSTRELIYTAVTRGRKQVTLWGREDILERALSRHIERSSGLRDMLWGKGEEQQS